MIGISGRVLVAPFAGAWIEIVNGNSIIFEDTVAPFAGAWIEMEGLSEGSRLAVESLPSRERGLKYVLAWMPLPEPCRSLRGSVD